MKTLALNIGNTSLFCGVFSDGRLWKQFRLPVREAASVRGFTALVARRLPAGIGTVALCSVVPALTPKFAAHARRQLDGEPQILSAAGPHGLRIAYHRPRQLGADRLAAALGARKLFPRRNVIVVDCGTATTLTALSRAGVLLGGAIFPGLALWPTVLAARTAQLPTVVVRRPDAAVGRATEENLRSGIYYGHLGAMRELVRRFQTEAFSGAKALVIGTGGHAPHFSGEGIFDAIVPALVLEGLNAFADTAACLRRRL